MAQGVEFVSKQYNQIAPYFASLDCPLISVSGDVVTVGGHLKFYQESGYIIRVYWDSTQLSYMSCNFPHSLEVYYGDNVLYVQGADPQNRRWYAFYEKIGDTVLYAGYCNNSAGTSRIGFNSITLTDASTGNTYTHGVMMNHTCDAGYIDYIPFTGLFANGYKKKNDNNFFACSITTQGITVTIDGKNYYAVSTSDLFPLS